MVSTSLQSDLQIIKAISIKDMLLPNPVRWRNYANATEYISFWRYLFNTTFVTVISVIGSALASSGVAFAFAKLRWPGRDFMFVVLLSTMMIPAQVTMIPLYLIFSKVGWVNSLTPLWFPTLFGNAFLIFLLRQFYLSIPKDFIDAARIDGCNYFQIYWRIMLPLVKSALIAVIVFQFLWSWNDFLGPLVYIYDRTVMTLSIAIQTFQSQHTGEWSMMMAASTLMTLPVVIIFFFAQRYFIQGVILSRLKE
jgi:multiple sugar transport system permease protein